jgi:hypothetical protein
MSGNTVKPWTQIVRVRDDIRTGQLSLQEFAADLFDVVNQTNKRPIYEDPAKFFSLSYATSAQRDIAAATAERLRGKSDKAIRQLELTYGGGKTHTLVTLTHLFRDPAALPDLPAVKEFESAMGGKAPKRGLPPSVLTSSIRNWASPCLAPRAKSVCSSTRGA